MTGFESGGDSFAICLLLGYSLPYIAVMPIAG